jgi:hypothetical protein
MVELCNRRVFTFRFHLQGKSKQPSTKYDKSPKGVADCCVFVVAIQENMPTTRRSTDKQFHDRVPPTKNTKNHPREVADCCVLVVVIQENMYLDNQPSDSKNATRDRTTRTSRVDWVPLLTI